MTYGELIKEVKKLDGVRIVYGLLDSPENENVDKFVELIEYNGTTYNLSGERDIDGTIYPNTIRIGDIGAEGGIGFDSASFEEDRLYFRLNGEIVGSL